MSAFKGYRIRKVNEICDVTSSKRIFASDYVKDGVPFYRGKEITERFKGELEVSTELFISRQKYEEIKNKFGVPQEGDLLLTSVGTLGSPYIVKKGEEFYFKDGNITWFRNFKNTHGHFMYYWFMSPEGKAELKKATIGSSQSAYTIVLLKEMRISLPPLATQRRIAAVLSAYDDLIENNQRRIAILEDMARNLYREWFVHFRFPGWEQARMVDAIPEGWRVVSLGDVINILGGGTPSTQEPSFWDGGNITWYSPSDLTAAGTMFVSDSTKKITQSGLEKSSARLFPAYSVMMTSRATIGVVAINTTVACTNQGFIICLPTPDFQVYHIYNWIIENREKIQSLASGATFREINKATFRKLPVILAPPSIEAQFHTVVEPIYKQIENLITKNANLRRQRDLLLPRLVSGELDVSELELAGVMEA